MSDQDLRNIFYEPVFENLNKDINYSVLYADILNKINKKFEEDNLIFHNLYFLNKKNQNKLKEFLDNFKILFDQDFVLTDSFNKKILKFFKVLSNNEKINLHKGYLKQYYCPVCESFLNKYDYYIKKEELYLHSIKLNVEEMVKPLVINVINLLDIIRADKFGLKGSDFANKKAIIPITGRKVPVFQVDNLNRPEVFDNNAENITDNEKKYSESSEFIKMYEENPSRLQKDLKINGAYELKIKREVKVRYCKKCNQRIDKRLVKSYYLDFNNLGQNYSIKTKDYILPINMDTNKTFSKKTEINVYNCTECDFYTFNVFEICPKCGNDLILNKINVSHELIKYFLPFLFKGDIKYYLVSEEKKDLIEDINKIISDLLDIDLKVENFIYLSDYRRTQNINYKYENIFKKLFIISQLIKKDVTNNMNKKSHQIKKFYYTWGKLFKKVFKQKLEELDLRTDFYIEKYITTLLQKLILSEKEASEKGDLIKYINNLHKIIKKANQNIYPYLQNINLEVDIYTYRVAYYFYKELILFISPFLLDYHNYPLKFPSYREDYNFEEELDNEKFIKNFIKKVEEGKKILKIEKDKETVVWVKTEDNVLMETLNTNSKYLVKFLRLDDIKMYDEKEMPKKRLELKNDDFIVYLPIFDVGRIKKIIASFKKELEDLKIQIIKNRLKLFDYEFLEKAPQKIIKKRKQDVKTFLDKKERLNNYIEILENIVGGVEKENE